MPRRAPGAKPLLAITVDMDEWYHCRWATGSPRSRWPDTATFFREHYGLDRPAGELTGQTARVLDLFARHGITATFFILGEVGLHYPDLVRRVADAGHEVACHGMRHVDLAEVGRRNFPAELAQAKAILEDLSGQPVVGYRAPNLLIEPWVLDVLESMGFAYDSSVCPSRSLFGKYGGMAKASQNPYRLGTDSLARPGGRPLVEIPIPSFPLLRLPAATGIMTRVVGAWWSKAGLQAALRCGSASYYFHPYEMAPAPRFPGMPLRVRLFLRRTGPWLERCLYRMLGELNVTYVQARELAASVASGDLM